MKQDSIRPILVLVAFLGSAGIARAEIPPEVRGKASHVVVGVVQAVFHRQTEEWNQFVVQIRVEKVEQGGDCKPGEFLYASCHQQRQDLSLPPPPGPGGAWCRHRHQHCTPTRR